MQKIALYLLLSFGFTACAATAADIRKAAIYAKGAVAAVRSNSVTIEEALAFVQKVAPPGSDVSNLDSDAQGAVQVINTSTDKELVEKALDTLIQHTLTK